MSIVAGTSSSTSGTLGNAPPVSFPGVASGIDYNAIIEKYTSYTLLQEKPARAEITNLDAQNVAILKLTNLLGAVQDALTSLSDPAAFDAYSATVSNVAGGVAPATAQQVAGESAIAGTYTIDAQTVATATSVTNDPLANGALGLSVPLDQAGASVNASNGPASSGSVTFNGVKINYDVTTQTIGTIVTAIDAALATSGGSAVLNADGTVTCTGVQTLGSGADSGNLLSVLKLDTARLAGGTITSSSPIAGINQHAVLNQNGNAGFATAVTTGSFTINGVAFTVDATRDTLADVITRINASSAGVTARFNSQTSALTLTSATPGPESILLGVGSDTSNLLRAAGLLSGTTTPGTQASLTYTDGQGSHTIFGSTNDFTTAIPGIRLTLTTSSPPASPGTPYYTVSVAPDPGKAEKAIDTFIAAYNAAISELNRDTAAPTISVGHTASSTLATSKQTSSGGVLYGNFDVARLRDQLVTLVSGFIPSGSNAYNSLSSVGIRLDTNSQSVGTTDADDTTDASGGALTVTSTSGRLSALDVAAFEAAYAANPTAVRSLFTAAPAPASVRSVSQQLGVQQRSATFGFTYQIGNLLANADGLVTFLAHSIVAPADLANVLLATVRNRNDAEITAREQQVALIDREATEQADALRAQFNASESRIAQLQSLQSQIAAIGH